MPFNLLGPIKRYIPTFRTTSEVTSSLTVAELLADRNQIQRRYRARARSFEADPLWNDQDTPLRSLYRMCEYLVIGWTIQLRNEIEYFWNHKGWTVSAVPDPKDEDHERYAILAALPCFLNLAFNRLIERGLPRYSPAIILNPEELENQPKTLEHAPAWCDNVTPLPNILRLPLADGSALQDEQDPRASEILLRWNILRDDPHVLFV